MKVINVDSDEWCRQSKEIAGESILYERQFISITEKSFNLSASYWLVYKGNKPILGLQGYTRNRSIVHPSIYTYTSLWAKGTAFDIQQAFVFLINHLQKEFKSIHLILPPNFQDVRPFIRNKFRVGVNYTYLKDINELRFNSKLKAREAKALSLGIKFKWDDCDSDIIAQNKRDFIRYGYGSHHACELSNFFTDLIKHDFAKGVSARLNGELVASGVVLTDYLKKHSSNCLISSEKKGYETGVNSGLYIHLFNGLKNDGFLSNDLCGANALGGGNFKSSFSDNLVPYYELKYSYWRSYLQTSFVKLRKLLKGA